MVTTILSLKREISVFEDEYHVPILSYPIHMKSQTLGLTPQGSCPYD